MGRLTATVTGSDTTYDVAVSGMTNTGTVTATVPAGVATNDLGKSNLASTSTDNSVQFVLAQKPTFVLTVPAAGNFYAGQSITIAWKASNVVVNTSISLCYDVDTNMWNNNEHWIEIDQVAAANGYGSYSWNTTGMTPGTYYIAGYLFSGGPIYSHLLQSFTILPPAAPTFQITAPTSGSFNAGQSVTVAWKASNVPAGASVSLCYDTDTNMWNGNEAGLRSPKSLPSMDTEPTRGTRPA